MKMKILIFIFFIIIIFNINNIKSQTINTFIPVFGEYNANSSWDQGRIPVASDIVLIPPNQLAFSQIDKIYGDIIYIGWDTQDNIESTLFNEYGISANEIWNFYGSTLYFHQIPYTNPIDSKYSMDVSLFLSSGYTWINQSYFYAPNSIVSNQLAVDMIIDSVYVVGSIIGAASVTISNRSEVYIPVLYFEEQSGFFAYSSNVYFTDPLSSVVLNTSSILNIYDSTFTCYSNFLIEGAGTSLYFENSVVRILNSSTSFHIEEGEMRINKCNDFISNKPFYTTGSNQTLIGIVESNVIFTEKSEFKADAGFIVLNSKFQTHKGFSFESSSMGLFSNSSMEIYGDFIGKDNSYFEFLYSNVSISNKLYSSESRIMGLQENCLLLFRNSNVKLDSNLVTVGGSTLVAAESVMEIKDSALFSGNSLVQMNYTDFTVNGVFSMQNSSTFVVFNSIIIVENSTAFFNLSQYSFNYVDFYVNGFFLDNTQATEIYNSFHFSNLTIQGFFGNNGGFYFNNSALACNGEFINNGILETINSSISVNQTFTNQANILMTNTNLKILSGSMVMKLNSNMTMIDSVLEILEGEVILESKESLLNLYNTTLINRNGSLKVNGDIIVNQDGTLTNNAKFILNSNVVLKDSGTGSTGNEEFTNNGILDIESDSDNSDSTNILIKFKNQGGSVNVGKNTTMLNLEQNNSSLTMKYDNTSLLIQNDLNSSYDSITFTVGLNSSSSINVNANANIENSILVIRIPNNLSNDEKNATLLSYKSLSGSGFKSYDFKTYDPKTGEEKDLNSCKHKVDVSGTSVNVLLNSQDECGRKSSLTNAQIAGIVVGIAGASIIAGVVVYFRNRLPKSQQLKHRLKQLSKDSTMNPTTSTA